MRRVTYADEEFTPFMLIDAAAEQNRFEQQRALKPSGHRIANVHAMGSMRARRLRP
jgi:hypothetical protein